MRSLPYALCLLLLLPAACAQVITNAPFSAAIARARSLEAGALAGDVPHHIHYDLALYSRHGRRTKGTWDIWRDPLHATRTDIVAGGFHFTAIEDLVHTTHWRHFNTIMPLKIYDLLQNFAEPTYAVSWLALPVSGRNVHFEQVEGSPFDCTNLIYQMRVCFDPLVHVLAFAQIFNETMTWEDWQPVGRHSIPGRFRIYDEDQVIVEATGRAEIVKSFPDGLFKIPANEPDMGDPEDDGSAPHKVISYKPVPLDSLYGNLLVKVAVNADGKVSKVDLVDADGDELVKPAIAFAKGITYAPQMTNGVAAPFEQYIYLRYAPVGE
ncbi:MAG: energy transducer TonB [Acidobacteriota bacterium]